MGSDQAPRLLRRCAAAEGQPLIERGGVESTFHKFRARYATMALAGTGNLLAVSRSLGHSDPASTAIYAATADSDLDLIAEAVTR